MGDPLYIKFAIFLQSIKYRYYPIFMISFVVLIIAFQRDFGPMLLAEYTTVPMEAPTDAKPEKATDPVPTNREAINFSCLINSDNQAYMEKIEKFRFIHGVAIRYHRNGFDYDYSYLCQITIPGTGKLAMPTPKNILAMMPWKEDNEDGKPRFLMSVHESVEFRSYLV